MNAACRTCRLRYPRDPITVDRAVEHLTHRVAEIAPGVGPAFSQYDRLCIVWLVTYATRRLRKYDKRLENLKVYDRVKVGGTA